MPFIKRRLNLDILRILTWISTCSSIWWLRGGGSGFGNAQEITGCSLSAQHFYRTLWGLYEGRKKDVFLILFLLSRLFYNSVGVEGNLQKINSNAVILVHSNANESSPVEIYSFMPNRKDHSKHNVLLPYRILTGLHLLATSFQHSWLPIHTNSSVYCS